MAQRLAVEFRRRGIDVSVVTRHFPHLPTFETIQGIPVYRAIRTLERGPLFGLLYVFSLGRFLIQSRQEFTILHIHHIYLDALAAVLLHPLIRIPIVARAECPGEPGDMARLRRGRFSRFWFPLLRRVDRVVALSAELRDELLAHGFPEPRITLIPNAVDTSRFSPAWRNEQGSLLEPRVIFVGRLVPQKQPEVLLRAWPTVVGRCPGARLLLIGTGPLEGELRALVQTLGVLGSVQFVGEVLTVEAYLRAGHVFVLPSRAEATSLALLEAMACGLPCVVTRIGGNVDIITDRVNGLLVEPGNSLQLAQAILYLLENPELAGRLGTNARQTVMENFSIDLIVNRYIGLYHELLHEAG